MKEAVGLYYTEDHEWVSPSNSKAKVGVSSHAVEQLGDIVHIELPSVGTKLSKGDSFGTIESTKTVSDLYAPCDGEVTAVNEKVLEKPESLTDDPYQEGWLIEISVQNDFSHLMNSSQYENYLKNEA